MMPHDMTHDDAWWHMMTHDDAWQMALGYKLTCTVIFVDALPCHVVWLHKEQSIQCAVIHIALVVLHPFFVLCSLVKTFSLSSPLSPPLYSSPQIQQQPRKFYDFLRFIKHTTIRTWYMDACASVSVYACACMIGSSTLCALAQELNT